MISHDYKILNDLRTQKGSLHIEWDFESYINDVFVSMSTIL